MSSDSPEITWKLPEGIENHIESGIIKATAGAVVGGVVGAIMFKSGSGMRSASMALGVGAAIGSTLERAYLDSAPKKSNGFSRLNTK